jgi:AcrR family transcriptional regulator
VSAVEDPSEALAALVTGSIQGLRENLSVYPLTLEVLSAAAAGEGRQRFAEQMRGVYAAYREIVAGLVRAGQRRGAFAADADAEAVAAHLVAAVDGLMLQYWLDRELDVEKAARELLRVTTRGLA